jgi:hypothetical protein
MFYVLVVVLMSSSSLYLELWRVTWRGMILNSWRRCRRPFDHQTRMLLFAAWVIDLVQYHDCFVVVSVILLRRRS